MDQNTSDNENLYVSMLDKYAILALLFMCFFVQAQGGINQASSSSAFIFSRSQGGTNGSSTPGSISARWLSYGETCAVQFSNLPEAARALDLVVVLCKPMSFGGHESEGRDTLRKIAVTIKGTSSSSVLIHCSEKGPAAIENCAKLQWTLLETGFEQVLGVVETVSKGKM